MSSTISLLGKWDLRDEADEHRLSFDMPGDGITALHKAGIIDDPYYGQNEYAARWICERDWIAKKLFAVETIDHYLVLSEVDCIAEICINGELVLKTKNAFKSYRVDISEALKIGENEIEVCFKSVIKYVDEQQVKQPYYVPYQSATCPIKNGNMVRKPQCDFGWDWNIALAPFGLYGKIQLEPLSTPIVGSLQTSQQHTDNSVDLCIKLPVENLQGDTPKCVFTIDGQTLYGKYCENEKAYQTSVTISNPNLWWPAGQGEQSLYDLTIILGQETVERKIGLCDIKLLSEPDNVGRSFGFEVNRRPVFAKGANWIPADALAGKIEQDKVREQLQSAVDANMNMIRIWGGGRYEPDWFYDLCDELGIMVWQDLMFSCNLYPATDEFLDEVEGEVRQAVERIDYHACLAVWCGDNELIGALGWHEESIKDRDRYLVAYDRLNRTIEQVVKTSAPHSNWWPSSPSPGPMSFGDAWHDDTSGDMHFWSVWHEGKDFDHYRDVSPRFCSEFGFQSYPSMNIIRQFADEKDFNIAAPVMESHQKNTGGNARIAETMFRYFRFPNSFENFVYLSQVQQGLAIKTAVTHWRSLKPHCMGTLVWQLNDTWPVCSWSSLDYGGGWKLLHHMEKHFYAPIFISAVPNDDHIILRAVNDSAKNLDIKIEAFAVSMTGEKRPLLSTITSSLVDKAIDAVSIDISKLHNDEFLIYRWNNGHGDMMQDHWAPKPYKQYDLPDPNISIAVNQIDQHFEITLQADKPTFYTSLECDHFGQFSDNAFLLLPNEPKQIFFTPKSEVSDPKFVIRDLRSATL